MAKQKTKFCCQECGYDSPKWLGKCPGCQAWNTFVEEIETISKTQMTHSSLLHTKEKAVSIINIKSGEEQRILTGNKELNRVLGGGLVPGSLLLVGGDPGIGKSTLLLQTSHDLTQVGKKFSMFPEKNRYAKPSFGLIG